MHRSPWYIKALALLPLLLAMNAAPTLAADSDDLSLSLGLTGDEPVTVSRFPRPISKIAEDVTVITADDIARLNAHTLADVLHTVPGIELNQLQGPGSSVFFTMLGVTSRHILVQLDGVPLNFLGVENLSEVGSIPVQMIDRVEIVKGAASAAWGPALGGVVNIRTKSPDAERECSGTASASLGEGGTSDLRGELSGTVGRLGYYLTGGNLHSDGLAPGNRTNLNHGFGKFTLELPGEGMLTLGGDVRENSMLLEQDPAIELAPGLRGIKGTGEVSYLNGYFSLEYPLARRLALEASGRGGSRELGNERHILSPGFKYLDARMRETFLGGGLALNWGDADTNLTGGLDYDKNDLSQSDPFSQGTPKEYLYNSKNTLERWSTYMNGTFSIGRFSILPGTRFEHTNLFGDVVSTTLGATVRLSESTLLRAYAARGYSMPIINAMEIVNGKRELQNVKTAQVGVESSAIPYLWVKGTLFYNNIWKVQTYDPVLRGLVLRDHIRRGVDLEFRTFPWYGLSLTGGYTYTDAWDKDSGAKLTSEDIGPRQGAKVAVNYDYESVGLRGALTGNYVDWVSPGGGLKDSAVIWDLHLTRRLFPGRELSPEFFFSCHNIFDGAQYQSSLHANASRWVEAGMRYPF